MTAISVVIPVRNDSAELRGALAALALQSVRPHEVIVVDNGSTDDSAAVALAGGARVVEESTPGIPQAAAAGYDAATGDVIARIDADSRPGPDWLARVEAAMADPRVDAATGAGRFHDLPVALRWPATVVYLGSYFALTSLALANVPLWGSAMALRTDAWRRVRHLVHVDADVHDDMDLTFALGSRSRIVFDRRLSLGVSGRSVKGRKQLRRRMERAFETLRLNWAVSPPWERWAQRFKR